MRPPLVSIVILTRNGADTLPALLESVARQQTDFPYELLAVDSGSTDGTIDLLRKYNVRIVLIAPGEFDHGLTRNLGIEQSDGELVVLLVQDAVPLGEKWLDDLTASLRSDHQVPAIAGSFARQTPRADASAITRYYHARWVTADEQPRMLALDSKELQSLPPLERLTRCAFDNVCSCVRRSVWEEHRFRSTPIAEDLEWAREVLLAGHRLVYEPRAVVVHSHDRPARYELARTYVLHRRLYELFGIRTVPTVGALVRAVGSSAALHVNCANASVPAAPRGTLTRSLALALAWPIGQYLGSLSAARGWKPIRVKGV